MIEFTSWQYEEPHMHFYWESLLSIVYSVARNIVRMGNGMFASCHGIEVVFQVVQGCVHTRYWRGVWSFWEKVQWGAMLKTSSRHIPSRQSASRRPFWQRRLSVLECRGIRDRWTPVPCTASGSYQITACSRDIIGAHQVASQAGTMLLQISKSKHVNGSRPRGPLMSCQFSSCGAPSVKRLTSGKMKGPKHFCLLPSTRDVMWKYACACADQVSLRA